MTKENGDSAGHAGETRIRVVVVGNGMVGHRFVERLAAADTDGRYQIVTFCEEPRPAYDRVHLTGYLGGKTIEDLSLTTAGWYAERGIELHIGERVSAIDLQKRIVVSQSGREVAWDRLVLATGSSPFVPPIPGVDKPGVFVYRTIEDLDAIRDWCAGRKRAAVMGGGLLGLEAARAVQELGLETHVVEFAPRLMPRQLDADGSAILAQKIAEMDVALHLGCVTEAVEGEGAIGALRLKDREALEVDALIISAGIRPRDELARECGLAVGDRGGVIIDDHMATSDPDVFAIGEVALHRGMIYGLVAPGYTMAEILADRMTGGEGTFEGADLSCRLKLMGVEVASFGDPFADGTTSRQIVFKDARQGIYKRLNVCTATGAILGGMLVGDASAFGTLSHYARSGESPSGPVEALIAPAGASADMPVNMQVCQCNDVSKAKICRAIADHGLTTVAGIKSCTSAGAGCGGCIPLVTSILNEELRRAGQAVKTDLCEHFPHTRQDLFEIIKIRSIRTFGEVIASAGHGNGCEICKPAVASILASLWNENIFNQPTIQDTNDRFLANIQRGGTYSVIPRVPGGEITPDQLIALGTVAKKYGLYSKITGGQRVDLLGARVDQLPDIWEELIAAGFESGHAYGKALRTVKSCVGQTWCRYGVQDSTSLAIRVENRYKGVRAPHKIKSAVSGCTRECAEAQGKDFGLVATEKGWNLYVCGNGGMKPRHADLLASDIDEDTAIRYIDRFLMYYIHTADRLTRTSVWLEGLEGGIDRLREVIIEDSLGLCAELESDMQRLIDNYKCEWTEVVNDPAARERFRHFADSKSPDPNIRFVPERDQIRPADWPVGEKGGAPADGTEVAPPDSGKKRIISAVAEAPRMEEAPEEPGPARISQPEPDAAWFRAAPVESVPEDGGIAVAYGATQIAVYNFSSRGEWYASQNMCPHMKDMVLARGLLGDADGAPKVACPLHKKLFRLDDGSCLSGERLEIRTWPARVEDGWVHVLLPPAEKLGVIGAPACAHDHATA